MKKLLIFLTTITTLGCTIFEIETFVKKSNNIYYSYSIPKIYSLKNNQNFLFLERKNYERDGVDTCNYTYLGNGLDCYKLDNEGNILWKVELNDLWVNSTYLDDKSIFWIYSISPKEVIYKIDLNNQQSSILDISSLRKKAIYADVIYSVCSGKNGSVFLGGIVDFPKPKFLLAHYKDGKLEKYYLEAVPSKKLLNVPFIVLNDDNTLTLAYEYFKDSEYFTIVKRFSRDLDVINSKEIRTLYSLRVFPSKMEKLYFLQSKSADNFSVFECDKKSLIVSENDISFTNKPQFIPYGSLIIGNDFENLHITSYDKLGVNFEVFQLKPNFSLTSINHLYQSNISHFFQGQAELGRFFNDSSILTNYLMLNGNGYSEAISATFEKNALVYKKISSDGKTVTKELFTYKKLYYCQ